MLSKVNELSYHKYVSIYLQTKCDKSLGKEQLFFPLSEIIPKSVKPQTRSSQLWRAHLWWPLQTYPIPYTCCHLFMLNGIANCSNYVDPDLKVISAYAPASQTLYSSRELAVFHYKVWVLETIQWQVWIANKWATMACFGVWAGAITQRDVIPHQLSLVMPDVWILSLYLSVFFISFKNIYSVLTTCQGHNNPMR